MIAQKEFLIELKKNFNLNIYEVKIWTALLSRGIATAGELSEISNVPRSRSYDVLESLEKKGFVIMKLGRPIKYIAVQPEEIISRVKKGIRSDTDVEISIIDEIMGDEIFKELELLHRQGIERFDIEKMTNAIIGRNNIYSFLKDRIENSKKSVLIATTAEGLKRKSAFLKNALRKAAKSGVKIRIAAPDIKPAMELEDIATLKQINDNARFAIIDNKELLIMIANDVDANYDTAIWIDSEFFASAVKELFERHAK